MDGTMPGAGKVKLSVFRWKKARLNRAIFQLLAQHGPLTPYDLRKKIRILRGFRYTSYSIINRRVRALQKEGFLEVKAREAQKAPQLKFIYKLTPRAELAMLLDKMDLDKFLRTADEARINAVIKVLSGKD